jgi:hypothetical protein
MPIHESKSLNDLEGVDRSVQDLGTYVTRTCALLRKKPLRELSNEELRVAIGQEMSVEILVPIALRRLAASPETHGDFYPGDVLMSVLRLAQEGWVRHPDWWVEAKSIADRFFTAAEAGQLEDMDSEFLSELKVDFLEFLGKRP